MTTKFVPLLQSEPYRMAGSNTAGVAVVIQTLGVKRVG